MHLNFLLFWILNFLFSCNRPINFLNLLADVNPCGFAGYFNESVLNKLLEFFLVFGICSHCQVLAYLLKDLFVKLVAVACLLHRQLTELLELFLRNVSLIPSIIYLPYRSDDFLKHLYLRLILLPLQLRRLLLQLIRLLLQLAPLFIHLHRCLILAPILIRHNHAGRLNFIL